MALRYRYVQIAENGMARIGGLITEPHRNETNVKKPLDILLGTLGLFRVVVIGIS